MTNRRTEESSAKAAERITSEKYCYGGHYTKCEAQAYRGRRYCLTCTERLTAQRMSNQAKDKHL